MAGLRTATLVQNQAGERVIKIAFPYDLDMLTKVRTLAGRKYHPESKVWSAPLYDGTVKQLLQWGFVLDENLITYITIAEKRRADAPQKLIAGLKGKLFPYQSLGVDFIESRKGRAIIADEMGLGKTIQALAWLQLHPENVPVVVVVPASLKLNWKKEAKEWLYSPNIEVLNGTKVYPTTGNILIINYDILWEWCDELKRRQPKVLIMDEIHYIKNNSTKRTKATKKLAKGIPAVIGLSGTLILNRPVEAFNAINLINPSIFSNYWSFTQRYCGAKYNGYGWDFNGASRTQELHQILTETVMIRRLKQDVLKDLPEKIYSFVPLELSNITEYRQAQNNTIEFIRQQKGAEAAARAKNAEVLARIEILKQLAVKGALKQAIEWIRDFLEEGEKLVVFATHHFVIEALNKEFGNESVYIDGSVNMTTRQKAVELFQTEPKVKLFIGNIQAAGVGITLTAASNVVFLELPWTPGVLRQAIDRLHRIGQKYTVNVRYLFAVGTIMEYIAGLIDSKQKTLDAVLDGKLPEESVLLSEIITYFENQ
jgi:SWI/SNF-related matrix-associated actin-dependent regulator of chromatin subfamily A-like protein 1